MPDHHNALPAGYRLGEYEIQTVLGSGGFGVTYKAHDHNLDKAVAIKEYLPPEFAVRDGRTTVKPKSSASKDDYAWGLDRFLDEARALARFDHPHINKVYRFFKENGTAYLVLEYVEGDLLSDLLRDKGRFSEAGIRRMLDELLDGLDAVHKAGYIHRDIKPANIMFRRDGSAVLLDFGAARQAIGQRSKTVTAVLTAGYAPVEQYVGVADAMGAWTDLYSLGVVAYRCLVGGNESMLVDALARAHYAKRGEMDKDMPPAVKVGKGKYSDGLLKAIDWAMQVEEGDRPQSVAEMQAALTGERKAAATAPPPKPKPAATSPREQAAEPQNNPPNKVVSAIVVGILLVGVGAVYKERQDERERVEAQRVADAAATERQRVAKARAAKVIAVYQAKAAATTNTLNYTPLHFAAYEENVYAAQLLIANGADVNAKAKEGITPLHRAGAGNSVGVARLLLANRAKLNARARAYNYTPLDSAISAGSYDSAMFLRQRGGQCPWHEVLNVSIPLITYCN